MPQGTGWQGKQEEAEHTIPSVGSEIRVLDNYLPPSLGHPHFCDWGWNMPQVLWGPGVPGHSRVGIMGAQENQCPWHQSCHLLIGSISI